MTIAILFIAAVAISAVAFARFSRRASLAGNASARTSPRDAAVSRCARHPKERAIPIPVPELEMLEWEAPGAVEAPPPVLDEAQARTRDRYLAARFPEAIACAKDLEAPDKVIEAARLFLDEDKVDCAHELLELAIERAPREESLRLAQLEIAFVKRDGERFLSLARDLRKALPACREWAEVERLGRALLPGEGYFGSRSPVRALDHHGPWPEVPNWLCASWDLTAEIGAAAFHNAMARAAARGGPARLRKAA